MNLQSEHTCCGFTEPRRDTMLPSISSFLMPWTECWPSETMCKHSSFHSFAFCPIAPQETCIRLDTKVQVKDLGLFLCQFFFHPVMEFSVAFMEEEPDNIPLLSWCLLQDQIREGVLCRKVAPLNNKKPALFMNETEFAIYPQRFWAGRSQMLSSQPALHVSVLSKLGPMHSRFRVWIRCAHQRWRSDSRDTVTPMSHGVQSAAWKSEVVVFFISLTDPTSFLGRIWQAQETEFWASIGVPWSWFFVRCDLCYYARSHYQKITDQTLWIFLIISRKHSSASSSLQRTSKERLKQFLNGKTKKLFETFPMEKHLSGRDCCRTDRNFCLGGKKTHSLLPYVIGLIADPIWKWKTFTCISIRRSCSKTRMEIFSGKYNWEKQETGFLLARPIKFVWHRPHFSWIQFLHGETQIWRKIHNKAIKSKFLRNQYEKLWKNKTERSSFLEMNLTLCHERDWVCSVTALSM